MRTQRTWTAAPAVVTVTDKDGGWCPKCGTEIKDGRSYCSDCGAQFRFQN